MATNTPKTQEIKVPVLPESVQDATIATWYKKPGEQVKRDDKMVDIETDKVVLEVVAPFDGSLENILKPQGSVVNAQEVIAVFKANEDNNTIQSPREEKQVKAEQVLEQSSVNSPSARRKMAEGTQISKTPSEPSVNVPPVALQVPELKKEISFVSPSSPSGLDRVERRVPMSRLRARVAERLVQVQQTAAILTTFNEINMHAVIELRQKYKELFEKKQGTRLGFMSFFVKATVEALKRFPMVNASVEGPDIVYHDYYDIGIAVSSPRGLVVPIIRNAEKLAMADIEKQISGFGQKAKEGHLSLEELTGGTFTISNGGVFGSLMATPIINPPQSGILGMHKIEQRPIVENGAVVIRPMMYVALSYDHRLIDGAESVGFLLTIKEILEDPARLLLGI